MDIKQVRDNLRKAKLYADRGDMVGSLRLALKALPAVLKNSVVSIEVRSCIRDVASVYATDKTIRDLAKYQFIYMPGKEQLLLDAVTKAYEGLTENIITETYDEILARKKALDQHIIRGRKYLKIGKVTDADSCFQEALKLYKDEDSIFAFIGKMFLEEKQIPRASFYLKRAHEVDPDNSDVKSMIHEVIRLSPRR